MKIVVVGCGAMGLPMARQLRRVGFDVTGFDVRKEDSFPGMESLMLSDLSGLEPATVLLVVVRDAQQINNVCFDIDAVFARPAYPRTVVVSSTVSPRSIDDLRQRLPGDVDLVDAPMSGAPYSAEEGSLTFMLGGKPETLERLMPAFRAMGDAIHIMGASGQGMLTKVMNNYVTACTIVAVRRSLDRAAENGLDAEKLLAVMGCSSGANWYADNLARIDWATEQYKPGNTIGILEKDVKCALDATQRSDEFDELLLQGLRDLPVFPS